MLHCNIILNSSENIILFDGVCALCNGFVQFVIRHDPDAHFCFAPLQSDMAQQMLQKSGTDTVAMTSVVLYQSGKVYTKSDAALRICAGLSGKWRVLYMFRYIPRPIRDTLYEIIAKNRYRLLGRMDHCKLPAPELRSRFLS